MIWSLAEMLKSTLPLLWHPFLGGFAQWYFCSASFLQTPLLQCSLCICPAVSFSHQRHLFPLIPHPRFFFPYQLFAALICFSTPQSAFQVPSLYHTLFHLILFFSSSLPPLIHCIHLILLFTLTSSLGICYLSTPTSFWITSK